MAVAVLLVSLSLSLLLCSGDSGARRKGRAVPFPRSCEQPHPPFWLTGSAVL